MCEQTARNSGVANSHEAASYNTGASSAWLSGSVRSSGAATSGFTSMPVGEDMSER